MDDRLRKQIEEAAAKVRGVRKPAPEPVAPTELAEWTGELMLSTLLTDAGYSRIVEGEGFYDVPVTMPEGEWDTLHAGAYIPELSKFSNYMPESKHISRMFLFLYLKKPVLFTGPPGTGKTTMAEFGAALLRQPFFRLNLNPTLENAELIGHQSVEGGSMRWVDGVLPVAAREGYFICLDEMWRAPSFVSLSLQGTFDKGGVIRMLGKHEDDALTPHPATNWVLTDNTVGVGDTDGLYSTAQVQDKSFLNRVGGTIQVGYMPRETEVESLTSEYPDVDAALTDNLVKLAGLCRTAYMKGEMELVFSKRQLETICSILPYVGEREAVDATFYSSLPESDKGVFQELWFDAMAYKW